MKIEQEEDSCFLRYRFRFHSPRALREQSVWVLGHSYVVLMKFPNVQVQMEGRAHLIKPQPKRKREGTRKKNQKKKKKLDRMIDR